MFKVVTTPNGTTVEDSTGGKGAPRGIDRERAEASAARRNAEAERLGLHTRYEVVPLNGA